MNFIQTDNPRQQVQVDMMNTLLRKWEHYIHECRECSVYDKLVDGRLTLYVDQETYYDIQELMSCQHSLGPLTIGFPMSHCSHDTTLFGYQLTILVVINNGRHDHLCFI